MPTDVTFIVEQIEDQKEAWKIDRQRAMECILMRPRQFAALHPQD
jgi:hypothetical protein